MTTLRDCYTPMEISEEEEELRADPYYRPKPVGWERTAQQYRQNNWSQSSAPFHKCFLSATREESEQAHTNAFRQRAEPYNSLRVDIPQQQQQEEKVIVSKTLSPNSKIKKIWADF